MSNRTALFFFITILFFNPLLSFSFASENKNEVDSQKKDIDIKYFNKIPKNDYIIGPGDNLLIIVSKDYPELTRNTVVNGEGTINLYSLGRIYVEGLTISELKSLIDKAYKDYVRYPDIEINIIDYRPVEILVNGEVNRPGLLTLKGSLSLAPKNSMLEKPFLGSSSIPPAFTNLNQIYRDSDEKIDFYFPKVFDAIQKSGGVTEYSNLSEIKLIRENSLSNGGGKIETILNLKKFILFGDDSHNIRIYDKDIIVIDKLENPDQSIVSNAVRYRMNPQYVQVIVSGRVNMPGVFKLSRESTLNDAIDMAGGTRVIRGPIKYLSFNNDGTIDKRKIKYRKNLKRGSFSNPYLKQGDLIVVGSSFLSNSAEAIKEITAPFQGLYSTYRLYELISE